MPRKYIHQRDTLERRKKIDDLKLADYNRGLNDKLLSSLWEISISVFK